MGRRTNLSIIIGFSLIFLTIVPGGMYLGFLIDKKLNLSPLFFILFSIGSIILSIYLIYKSWEMLQKNL